MNKAFNFDYVKSDPPKNTCFLEFGSEIRKNINNIGFINYRSYIYK